MVLQRIKDIFATPQEATSLDGARPGKAILVGTVEAGDEALSSPLRRIHCVAFYYKSIWMPPAKSNDAPSEHTKAAVYAAALDGDNVIDDVVTTGLPDSLKKFLEPGHSFNQTPEIYCFGLLQNFDIPQLRELMKRLVNR